MTEAGTDRPLARVDIRAISPGVSQPHSVKTDASGRYEVTGLPPGRYVVAASKTNYLTTSFGATRAMGPGKGFDLADGQVAEQINFALLHGGAIAGRVVDAFGDPAVGVLVTTMRYQYVSGERRMTLAQGRATTNDIGEFRLFGLPPGDYFVSGMLRDSLSGENVEHITYAPTFYPGTDNPADAQRLTVAAGQTVDNITLSLFSVQPTRISGSVADSSGRAISTGAVNLTYQIGGVPVGGSGAPVRVDGTFTINGVTPGDYILRINGPDDASAVTVVSVNGAEVSNVQLIVAPPSVLRGRIVFGSGAKPLSASAIRLTAIRDDPRLGGADVTLHDDLTFEYKLSAGHFVIRAVNIAPQWHLSRVLADNVDITDTGIDVPFKGAVPQLIIELTHHVSELSGRVLDARGVPIRDCSVIVFLQDSTRWTPQSRHAAASRPAGDDRFHVLVPPGDYFVFATADVEPGQWTDPAYLARIRDRATRVSVAEDEKKTIDLRLAVPPGL